MKISDCKHVNEWDYKIPYELFKDNKFFGEQNDWNQTLMTKMNQTSAMIFKSSYRGGANVVEINPKLLTLFDTLEYYQPILKSLSGRYVVIENDELEDNVIFMRHVFKESEWNDIVDEHNEWISENKTPLPSLDEYKLSLNGCVKILNYK